jgi:RNA polymerase sigma-70 factor (ECF subfamily)
MVRIRVGRSHWVRICPAIEIARQSANTRPLESSLSREQNQSDQSADELERRLSDWMQAAQGGDAVAYRNLLTTIQPKIRAIVRGKIREEAAAEDVVQNTLLSIHRGRSTYRAERPFGPWMRAIVRNSIIDHFRERKRRGDREVELVVEEWPAEEEAGSDPLAPELAAALAALPEAQREAVTLIQLKGLSVAEAALRVGISPGALKVRAHRGYRAMREALEGARESGEWSSSRPPRPTAKTTSGGAG